jgi:uncharacterized protein (DUF1330 family)
VQIVNELFPSRPEQVRTLMESGPQGPVFMVNLLKFKARAQYEDGRATTLTGREAYHIYGRAVTDMLPKYGAMGIFAGDVTALVLGQADSLWDEIAIARYPNRRAMVEMSTSKAWREIAVHRTAGLAGQLNIETVLQPDFAPQQAALFELLRGAAA